MSTLTCTRVLFYSLGDEETFYGWIERIPCIEKYKGVGDEFRLSIIDNQVDDDCLRELIALFNRYDVDMKQLRQFENEHNRAWFADPEKAWHQRVFGSGGHRSN